MGRILPVRLQSGRLARAAALGAWLAAAAGAQEPVEYLPAPLTREDCIAAALVRHPAIKTRQAGVGVAYQQTQVARSYFLPQVDAGAVYTYIDEPLSVDFNLFEGDVGDRLLEMAAFFEIARQTNGATAVAALDDLDGPAFTQAKQQLAAALPATIQTDLLGRNFVTTQIRLVQPLWAGGQVKARYQQARSANAIARYDVAEVQQAVGFNVSRAYLSVLLTRDLQECANAASKYAGGVAEIAQALVDDGDRYVTMADVLRAETFRALYAEQAVGMQVAVDRAHAGLRLAMGMSQLEDVTIADDTLPVERFEFDQQALISLALAQRPELRKARAAIRLASLERDAAKGQYHPQVGAYATYNTINDDANFPNPNDTTKWALGVGASMPLYAGGRITAQVRQANYLTCQAVEARNFVGQMVEQEVVDSQLELKEMDRRMAEAATAVDRATKALEAFKDLFNAGANPEDVPKHYENLLTTRLLLVTAQVRYIQSLYGYNVALARIRLAAGMAPLTDFVPESDDDEALRGETLDGIALNGDALEGDAAEGGLLDGSVEPLPAGDEALR